MATVNEYFTKDFALSDSFDQNLNVTIKDKSIEIQVKVLNDVYSGSKFISCYIPPCNDILEVCRKILIDYLIILKKSNEVKIKIYSPFDKVSKCFIDKHSVFTGTIYFYIDNWISNDQLDELNNEAKKLDLAFLIRDKSYSDEMTRIEKPLAFVSHDSRDKKEIVLPIVLGLKKILCPVWYDEYSLQVGDSLCESIDKAIKETKHCILVLSKNFLSNRNWARLEFKSAFIKALINNSDTILPVWVDVTRDEIFQYHATLADIVAVKWSDGIDKVISELSRKIK